MTVKEINGLIEASTKIAYIDTEKSLLLATEAYDLAVECQLPKEIGESLYSMSYSSRILSDYTNALKYAFDSLEYYEKLSDGQGLSKSHNMLGIIYFYYGSYGDALENFMITLKLLKGVDNRHLECAVMNNIGELYREADDYDNAIAHFYLALSLAEEFDLLKNCAAIHINIGEIQYRYGKLDQAQEHFEKAYALSLSEEEVMLQGQVETKLGKLYIDYKAYDQARTYFLRALQKFNSIKTKYYLIDLLVEMSNLDLQIGNSPLNNLMEALNHAKDKALDHKISLIYKKIAAYYESIQDYKSSLEHYKAYHLKEKEIEASNLSKKLEIISIELSQMDADTDYNAFQEITEKLKRDIVSSNQSVIKLKSQNSKLMEENVMDQLTQLYNRRGIEKKFNKIFAKNIDGNSVLFILDIDNFKDYNDYWGHLQGDVCLTVIAHQLKEVSKLYCEQDSFVGRYGGEEFIAFFSNIGYDRAVEVGRALRLAIEKHSIKYTDEENSDNVTVSVGGVYGNIDIQNMHGAMDLADRRLYEAKESGKNCMKMDATSELLQKTIIEKKVL